MNSDMYRMIISLLALLVTHSAIISSVTASCASNEFSCGCDDDHYAGASSQMCLKVFGTDCSSCDMCELFPKYVCGPGGTCECKVGFQEVNLVCEPVLGRDCTVNGDADCDTDANIVCGTTTCVCETGYVASNSQCIPSHCDVQVNDIPDKSRRSVNFTTTPPAISDGSSMVGQWYSIGMASIPTTDPGPGKCGTLHPIYVNGDLTQNQISQMQTGTVTVTAKISGLQSIAPLDEIQLKLRSCGQDTHVQFVTAPPRNMSALCVGESAEPSSSSLNQPIVYTTLNFTQVTEDGVEYDVPHVEFLCYIDLGLLMTDNRIYKVSWYIDDEFLVAFDGLSSTDYFYSNITDLELRDFYGTNFMNKQLRCSVEYCMEAFQYRCAPVFSEPITLGIQEGYHLTSTPGQDSTIMMHMSSFPLGCKADVGTSISNCTLTFKPADDPDCQSGATGNDRYSTCGMSLIGVTKKGYEDILSSQFGASMSPISYTIDVNMTTYHMVQRIYGTHAKMDGTDHDSTEILAADLAPTADSTGQLAWDNYDPPTLKLIAVSADVIQKFEMSKVTVGTNPNTQNAYINKTFLTTLAEGTPSVSEEVLPIGSIGTFLVMRSRKYPFEFQVATESCDRSNNGVCLCGYLIRDGNDIYMQGDCDGVNVTGLLYGSGQNYRTSFLQDGGVGGWYRSLNGMLLSGNMSAFTITDAMSEEAFFDGIAGYNEGSYVMRDGSTTTVSSDFINNWKATDSEDLSNPANHDVRYKWEVPYHPCGCPSTTDTVPSSYVVLESENFNVSNVYTGVVDCDLQTTCTYKGEEVGQVWQGLGEDYSLNEVKVTANISWSGNTPQSYLKCQFAAVDGYKYKTEWLSSGSPIKDSGIVSGAVAQDFTLLETDATGFELDGKVQCKVSVYHGVTNVELVPGVLSAEFTPVEVQTPVVSLPRGYSNYITLKVNLPYGCTPGRADCCLQFLVYDSEDAGTCSNSSIAVQSQNLCGAKATAATVTDTSTTYIEPKTVLIDIVTKNNDQYQLKTNYTLRIKSKTCDNRGGIWEGLFSTQVKVNVEDVNNWKGRYCTFNNDPRGMTFDGLRYNFPYAGQFIVYQSGNMEVQMETEMCNFGASCVCGVSVRAGKHICAVNFCGDNTIAFEKRNETSRVLKCYQSATNRNLYKAKFPQGTWVYVESFISGWMNLNIYASASDFNNVGGLCGNFNGDLSDEWVLRNGTVYPSDFSAYGPPPESFSEDWEVKSTDFSITYNHSQLHTSLVTAWNSSSSYCVCNDANHQVSTCFADEEDTCTAAGRKKRSTANGDVELANKQGTYKIRNQPGKSNLTAATGVNPDAISEIEARQKCEDQLSSCVVYSSNKTDELFNKTNLLEDCTQDQMLNGSRVWASTYCSQTQGLAEKEVSRNKTLRESEPEVQQTVSENSCPGSCSGRGQCVTGNCQCETNYGSSDCSCLKTKKITMKTPDDNKVTRETSCFTVEVDEGDTFSDEAVCKIKSKTIKGSNETDSTTEETVPASYESYRSVDCCKTATARRRRSASSSSTNLGTQDQYSVSNDGVTFSDPVTIYAIDTTCLNITEESDGSFSAIVLSGYCVIDGTCYTNGTQNPTDVCQYCSTDLNIYEWTPDNVSASCQATTASPASTANDDDDGLSGGIIAAIVVCALLAVAGGVAAAVVVYLKVYRPRNIRPTGGLFEGPHNDKFKMRKESLPQNPKGDMWYEQQKGPSLPETPSVPENAKI